MDTVAENAAAGTDALDYSAVTNNLLITIGVISVKITGGPVTNADANIDILIAGSGSNTISYAGSGVNRIVTLTGLGSSHGFAGVAAGMGSFDNIDTILGGNGNDTLNGLNDVNTWTVNSNSSMYNGSGRTLSFSGFEVINGGGAVDNFNLIGAEFGTFNGNAGADVFNFANGATLSGSIDGGSGSDTINFAGNTTTRNGILTGIGTSDGFAGTIAGGGFSNINILIGGNGVDSLTGRDASANWQLNGLLLNNTYSSVNGLTFTGFESIIGGNGVDTFTLASETTYAGSLNGAAGIDTLTYAAYTSARAVTLSGLGNVDGFNGTEANITGGFTNINVLVGSGASSDVLTGMNAAATWNIDGTNQYIVNPTLDFSSFEILVGGSAADTFNISGTQTYNLKGGAGDDLFKFINNGDSLNGTIDGDSGLDTLDYSIFINAITVNIAAGTATGTNGIIAVENVIGGSVTTNITGDAGNNVFVSSGGNVTLKGFGGNDTYIFLNGWGTTLVEEGAGAGNDIFDFSQVTTTITFAFDGAGLVVSDGINSVTHIGGQIENFIGSSVGNDLVDVSALSSGQNASLTGLGRDDGFSVQISNIGLFDNINALKAGGRADDTLNGLDQASAWILDGVNSAYVSCGRTLGFAGFGLLNGGSSIDTFYIASNAALTGSINGGGGMDTLDYASHTAPVAVNLFTSIAQGITGTVNEIENIIGGSAGDNLIGNDVANVLNGNGGDDTLVGNAGDDTLVGGAGNDTVSGGLGNDTYSFADNWGANDTVVENGIAGDDTLDFSAVTQSLTITLNGLTITEGINKVTHIGSGIDNLIGSSVADTFNVDASRVIDFFGSGGDDSFVFSNGVILTGILDGGSGDDTLNFAPYAVGRSVLLKALGAVDGFAGTSTGILGTFTNINLLVGSNASGDVLIGLNSASVWTIDGNNQYTAGNSLSFVGFENLQGGSAVDTFNISGIQNHNLLGGSGDDFFIFTDKARVVGTVDGQGGSDRLDFSAVSSARRIVLIDLGSQNGFAGSDISIWTAITVGFDNINYIIGSSDPLDADILVGLDRDGVWVVGETGIYQVNPELIFVSFETLTGGSGNDTFYINGTRNISLFGGAGDDKFILGKGAVVLGSINGQDGMDTLEYDEDNLPAYDPATGTATGVHGGISNLERFTVTVQPVIDIPDLPIVYLPVALAITESGKILFTGSILAKYLPISGVITLVNSNELIVLSRTVLNIIALGRTAQIIVSAQRESMAQLSELTQSNLPAPLPSGYRYFAGLKAEIFAADGTPIRQMSGGLLLNLSFALPENYESQHFMLLYWDETLNSGSGGWVEITAVTLVSSASQNTLWVYYRYWDVSANGGLGDWATIIIPVDVWQFGADLGEIAWAELPFEDSPVEPSIVPNSVLTALVDFTGIFVLVTLP